MPRGWLLWFAPFEPIPHGFSPTLDAKNIRVPPTWRRGIIKIIAFLLVARGAPAMADIMTNCPFLKMPVKTGLTTETIVFESLSPSIEVPFRCPACREVHRRTRIDAWVDKSSNGQGSAAQKGLRVVSEMPH